MSGSQTELSYMYHIDLKSGRDDEAKDFTRFSPQYMVAHFGKCRHTANLLSHELILITYEHTNNAYIAC